MKTSELIKILSTQVDRKKESLVIPMRLDYGYGAMYISYMQDGLIVAQKIACDNHPYWGAFVDAKELRSTIKAMNAIEVSISVEGKQLIINSPLSSTRLLVQDTWDDPEDVPYNHTWSDLRKKSPVYFDWDFYFSLDFRDVEVLASTANVAKQGNRKIYVQTFAAKVVVASAWSETVQTHQTFLSVQEVQPTTFSLPVKVIDILDGIEFTIINLLFNKESKTLYLTSQDIFISLDWDESPVINLDGFGDYYSPGTSMSTKQLKATIKDVAKICSIIGVSALENPIANLIEFNQSKLAPRQDALLIEGCNGAKQFGSGVPNTNASVTVCAVQLLDIIQGFPDDLQLAVIVLCDYDNIPQLVLEGRSKFVRIMGFEQRDESPDMSWDSIINSPQVPEKELLYDYANTDLSTLEIYLVPQPLLREVMPLKDREIYEAEIYRNWDYPSPDQVRQISLVDNVEAIHFALVDISKRLEDSIKNYPFEDDEKIAVFEFLSDIIKETEKITNGLQESDPQVHDLKINSIEYLEGLLVRASWLGTRIQHVLTHEPTWARYCFSVT
jgi:hypothetical protein